MLGGNGHWVNNHSFQTSREKEVWNGANGWTADKATSWSSNSLFILWQQHFTCCIFTNLATCIKNETTLGYQFLGTPIGKHSIIMLPKDMLHTRQITRGKSNWKTCTTTLHCFHHILLSFTQFHTHTHTHTQYASYCVRDIWQKGADKVLTWAFGDIKT